MPKAIKVDRYYDVGCDYCGRHLSTDFCRGMFPTVKEARYFATQEGFRNEYGKTLCPVCLMDLRRGIIRKEDLNK